ncbi:glycoside hydrolase family 43 protein [Goodfellowiella coeruleoviolacea]|uniref:Glycosyl hydrolases family 43 n=1 Tax=Goodfellowiella coeruleoviolacea TaxID=334858 RepID=A0AAE3GDX3_9PSEU|nr:glycoside hydrolase family 43 protein [Goodfellowiella coeruleoviolacea]MCP2166472.1 Glycosyl hydrolases family 43 [Goodfellowiella coeruleoviolacea]
MQTRVLAILGTLIALVAVLAPPAAAQPRPGGPVGSTATYHNNAATPGADPYVRYDAASGYYYAYSTEGADPGFHFAIYRSPDLATWQRLPGGALRADDGTQWGHDWFWAPEVYHNPDTGLYFLFYAARMNTNVAEHFGYADFEEPCKIGVAVATSPAGPFTNIVNQPIDYFPYDPAYHDVNLIMDATQKKPPATLAEGQTAPLGTYLPTIDPNVFFAGDGRVYLYFSRNAYRNWVWDHELGKYVEESNIYAVELTTAWWHDPTGTTMPTIAPAYVDANRVAGDDHPVRRDGFTPILSYGADPQDWENAHVDDYARTNGANKDRRWAEGSSVIESTRVVGGRRQPVYYLTYSANNYENAYYGVGYAVADSPLGPWRKSPANPILAQDSAIGMYSTGHGSIVATPDGSQLYYVHHGRSSTTTGRALYTERMRLDAEHPDPWGNPALVIDQSTADEPVPAGVAPYTLSTDTALLNVGASAGATLGWRVTSASGAAHDLANPLNRVDAVLDPAGAARIDRTADGAVLRAAGPRAGVAALTLTYQRQSASGQYGTVANLTAAGRDPVSVTLPVAACTTVLTGQRPGPLTLTSGVTCLTGAAVGGPVRVGRGAALVAVDSVIAGPVHADRGQALWLSGGRVAGGVDVSGATGPVRLDRVSVAGPVSVSGATGGVVIERSTLRGPLACTGNTPPPTDNGRPNQVRGPATGQCRGW